MNHTNRSHFGGGVTSYVQGTVLNTVVFDHICRLDHVLHLRSPDLGEGITLARVTAQVRAEPGCASQSARHLCVSLGLEPFPCVSAMTPCSRWFPEEKSIDRRMREPNVKLIEKEIQKQSLDYYPEPVQRVSKPGQ